MVTDSERSEVPTLSSNLPVSRSRSSVAVLDPVPLAVIEVVESAGTPVICAMVIR